MSKNFKIFLGISYLTILFVFLYFIFTTIQIGRLNDFSYYKEIQLNLDSYVSSNFTINNLFTFRANKLKGKRFYFGLMKFLLVSSLPMIANVGVTNLFYNQLSTNTFFSQLAGIFVVFIWNYAASSKVVWNL